MKMCREKGRESVKVIHFGLLVAEYLCDRLIDRDCFLCFPPCPSSVAVNLVLSKEREQHEMIMCAGGNYLADGVLPDGAGNYCNYLLRRFYIYSSHGDTPRDYSVRNVVTVRGSLTKQVETFARSRCCAEVSHDSNGEYTRVHIAS